MVKNKETEEKKDAQGKKQDVHTEKKEVLAKSEVEVGSIQADPAPSKELKKEKKEDEGKKEAPVLKSKKKKKIRRQVQRGKAYIRSTYNNTVVSFADLHGNLLAWSSAGSLGFKGAKKATTFAANQVVLDAADKVEKYGLKDIEVFVKGVGSGREAAIRALAQRGFNLSMIKDKTPIPHNGCRPKKPRRV